VANKSGKKSSEMREKRERPLKKKIRVLRKKQKGK
jgi:hypothetical protein